MGIRGAYVQLNVTNIFDERYLANISTANSAGANGRTGSLGSPRTAVVSLGLSF